VYLTIDVPDFSAAPLAIGGLLIGAGGPERVPMAATSVSLPFTPSVDREFQTADTLRIYFDVVARRAAAMNARVEVRDAGGRVVKGTTLPMAATDRGHVDLQLPLAGMMPGAYVLRVSVSDPANTAYRETGFLIR
jgi:hypothetical protein